MSYYPVWWERTLTVYNKFEDSTTRVVSWHRTVLYNCFWKHSQNKLSLGETVLETDFIICRIPQNSKFLEKYQWITIPNDEKDNYFTLAVGDIIVRGEVEENINEYVSGKRSTDFLAKYKALQGAIEIEEVEINIGRGRNNPHYYVKGV